MFEYNESGGMFDSWIDRWRIFRGVDKWPLVDGRVTSAYFVDAGEGGYYKLTIEFEWPPTDSKTCTPISVRLQSNSGSRIGDIVRLRVNPRKPTKVVLGDTSQSAVDLMMIAIFVAVVAFLLTIKACNAFFADPH